MTAPRPNNEAIFHAARDILDPDCRREYVRAACKGDETRIAHVEAMLAAADAPDSLLDRPAGHALLATINHPPGECAGTVIGPYKLLQQIGEGGMGVVWMAEQTQPVQRKVALKVIKPGMDSRQVIARFEAERQALAMMDHVNIARVFDGGATETGRPYFVMELVHGVPITKYCDDNHLTPRQRLELFVPVCQAIQHAHQKGIIHRDIKPSNVMVTLYDGKPVPKVIDFGVAKATEQKLTERTLFTQYGTMVGTLEYMSPEQAAMSALGVDTRSDIYSLGVLLYELLTGTTPLDRKRMKEAAYAEILRMIKEEEPPKPSTRLSDSGEALASISANRHTEPAKLTKLVRGELDWIVMKTLEKERNRRYETASAFASDLQRYLNDEPVQACPPSAWYRFGKYARRNKVSLCIAGLVLLVVVLIGGSTGWIALERQARHAETWHQVDRTLQEAKHLQAETKWTEAAAVLRRAESLLDGANGDEEQRRRTRAMLADSAMVAEVERIRFRQAIMKDERFDLARSNDEYARAFKGYGIDVEHLSVTEAAERIRVRAPVIRSELLAALDDWAYVRRETSKKSQDPEPWRRLLQIARRADTDPLRKQVRQALEEGDRKALQELAGSKQLTDLPPTTLLGLGVALAAMKAHEEAVAVLRKAQQRYPGDFAINNWLQQYLTKLYVAKRMPPRWDEVLRFATAAAALRPQTAGVHHNLANTLARNGAIQEAAASYREALRLKPDYASAYLGLGYTFNEQGDIDKAIQACRDAIRLKADYAHAHASLGSALVKKHDLEEGIACFRKAIELDPKNAQVHRSLGVALRDQGKLDEAIISYRKAIEIDPQYADAYVNLGVALWDQKKLDEAVDCYLKAIEIDPKDARTHNNLGLALKLQKKLVEAMACCKKAIDLDPKYAAAHNNLGGVLGEMGRADDAIAAYEEAIRIQPDFAPAHYNLGIELAKKRDVTGAEASYRKAIFHDPRHAEARINLGRLLREQGKLDDAIAAFREAIRVNPKHVLGHYNLGLALTDAKKPDEAIAAYRAALLVKPDDGDTHINLGIALERKGELDEAITILRTAVRLEPKAGDAHYTLGVVLGRKGEVDEAMAEYRTAIKLAPNMPEAHCNLGLLLQKKTKFAEALVLLRKGHELGSKKPGWAYPSNEWVAHCAYLADLDARLPAVLDGREKAVGIKRLEFAEFCQRMRRSNAGAARLYAEGFVDRPELPETVKGLRYNAACAAALAGSDQDDESRKLEERERARWRKQAIDWLRADLTVWTKRLDAKPEVRAEVRKTLLHWQADPDLVGLRDAAALAKLPEPEQDACRRLWSDVARLLAKTEPPAK